MLESSHHFDLEVVMVRHVDTLSQEDWEVVRQGLNQLAEGDVDVVTCELSIGTITLQISIDSMCTSHFSVQLKCDLKVKYCLLWLRVEWLETEDDEYSDYSSSARFQYDEGIGGFEANVSYETNPYWEGRMKTTYLIWGIECP